MGKTQCLIMSVSRNGLGSGRHKGFKYNCGAILSVCRAWDLGVRVYYTQEKKGLGGSLIGVFTELFL